MFLSVPFAFRKWLISSLVILTFGFFITPKIPPSFAQAPEKPGVSAARSPLLIEGIEQYRKENFEEAVEILKKVRENEPESSRAAFFLGLSYKQVMDYKSALANLKDAVTLTPRIKEALVELIDVLYRLNKLEEAREWIAVAEKEDISPAKVAFLKGLVLQKEKKNLEAVKSFERAKELDQSMAQSADFQIGLCYLKERKLKRAKEKFQATVTRDPQTDLASFARQYIDVVEERIFLERPLRVALGVFGQYDTNLVLKPIESALAPEVTDERSLGILTTARVAYVPVFESDFLFSAQYSFVSNVHEKHSTTHDLLGNTISVSPGYNFGRFAINAVGTYSHVLVRGTSYKRYLDYMAAGPLLRVLITTNHILELYGGYNRKEYDRPPLIPEEDRDSDGLNAYASWIWSFKKGALFNLKYEYSYDHTDGENWENEGNRFTASVTIPLMEKVSFQATGDVFFQDFQNVHTIFNAERRDHIYTGSVGLNWQFYKNAYFIVQYTGTRSDSTIGIYDYKRNLYSAGVEYRF